MVSFISHSIGWSRSVGSVLVRCLGGVQAAGLFLWPCVVTFLQQPYNHLLKASVQV